MRVKVCCEGVYGLTNHDGDREKYTVFHFGGVWWWDLALEVH